VSWFGNNLSYEIIGNWCRRDIVSVSRKHPIRRAVTAGTGEEKKNQTWAPLPDRDR
jgi:hypothetical protein